ncbi:Oidioi.mRNA.OKI2018_I69.chr1.g2067.t1.cds [Oikopleura dioica]|uniref:Oidioi.mRNA.OKI2018_I69.chr1.g2067.t1.cds n=1 Tax=Oikopleura dioica TaxID=34765 RepID=A0ABN7STE8_OIKDI|nr:Oidioi.mRNA.OKI2018_I69.chr1.g2067.t1.cds [Oikopleura dioica]
MKGGAARNNRSLGGQQNFQPIFVVVPGGQMDPNQLQNFSQMIMPNLLQSLPQAGVPQFHQNKAPGKAKRKRRKIGSEMTQIIGCPSFIRPGQVNSRKDKPKASTSIQLPDPLPDCVEKIKSMPDLHCEICDLTVNSRQQLTQHLGSTRHKMVQYSLSRGLTPVNIPSAIPKVGQYRCKKCDIVLNSEAQLMQHLNSYRHKNADIDAETLKKFENDMKALEKAKEKINEDQTGNSDFSNCGKASPEICKAPEKQVEKEPKPVSIF